MALVFAAVLAYFERQEGRVYLRFWRLSWLAFAALAGGALAGRRTARRKLRTAMYVLLGTALVAGGAAALNQVWERETDALMRRTQRRPLPAGRLGVVESRWFGLALSAAGLIELATQVNVLSAAVAGATLVSYVLVYTPLKIRTSLSTLVGAIPGALPPVIGWAATTGRVELGALVLFGIVFLWQMPHFLAIAWMYRDDYAAAGMPMLPVIEPDGRRTAQRPPPVPVGRAGAGGGGEGGCHARYRHRQRGREPAQSAEYALSVTGGVCGP